MVKKGVIQYPSKTSQKNIQQTPAYFSFIFSSSNLNSYVYYPFCQLIMYCFNLFLEKQYYVGNRACVFESNLDLNSSPGTFFLHKPQFPHLQSDDNITHLKFLLIIK